jgi:peptidoglycan/LPS O-acetylase OafA/YrhL
MGGVNPNLYLVLAFSSSLFVAALIYKYVERPIYERLNAAHRHLINRRRPASAVAV